MRKLIYIVLLLFLLSSTSRARRQELCDSSMVEDSSSGNVSLIPRYSYFLPLQGVCLVTAASLMKYDHKGSTLHVDYKPSFDYKADEVLRFVPALAVAGMKVLGVESRSSWKDLLINGALSTAIMGTAVESTKRINQRVRPDGSDDRSFPSGHTATAFMTATIFAKEYGHLSPWYTVGAYGVATSTAMLRRINDHHWVSDVIAGAGIGILSTELAYCISDLLHKDKPSFERGKALIHLDRTYRPSFAGTYITFPVRQAIDVVAGSRRIETHGGYHVGMETAYFFLPYIGIGGQLNLSTSRISIEGIKQVRSFDNVTASAGPCFSYPILNNLLVGMQARGGYGFYPRSEYNDYDLTIGGCCGWGYEVGASLILLFKRGFGLSLKGEYEQWSDIKVGDKEIGYTPYSIGLGISRYF